jgi:hypothetical protein
MALAAASAPLIEYSTNARGYILVCLCFLILISLAADVIKAPQNNAAWFLLSIVTVIGVHTIPIMVYPWGIICIWVWLTSESTKVVVRPLITYSLITAIISMFLYSPVLLISGLASLVRNPYVTPKSWNEFFVGAPGTFAEAWEAWHMGIPVYAQYVMAGCGMLSLLTHFRLSAFRVPLVVAVLLWIPILLVAHRAVPFARVWLFLLPIYIASVCAGVYSLLEVGWNKWEQRKAVMSNALAIALTIVLGYQVLGMKSEMVSGSGTFKEAETVTLWLGQYLKPGDKVLVRTPSDAPLYYYFWRYGFSSEHLFRDLKSAARIIVIVNKRSSRVQDRSIDGMIAGEFGVKDTVPRLVQTFGEVELFEVVGPRKIA